MNRTLIIKSLEQIKKGKTFYRSNLPQTVENKKMWDELRQEMTQGYTIDLPLVRHMNSPSRA